MTGVFLNQFQDDYVRDVRGSEGIVENYVFSLQFSHRDGQGESRVEPAT